MNSTQALSWVLFNIFIVAMLVLDLKVLHRKPHLIGIRESLLETAGWIALALAFNVLIYFTSGRQTALEFLTGYLIEKSLSVDNLFVFLVLFNYFGVPSKYQHNVLFWGIVGAIFMRGAFILGGIALISRLHAVIYVFGAFLVFTGIKLAFQKEKEVHPEKNPVFRFMRRFFPLTERFEGDRFAVRRDAKILFTPLFVVLVMIESMDIVFAVDSIPAIFAVTLNPFIVYSSNMFAILGLRSLYFALAGMMHMFHYLSHGLSFVLVFIGVKMLLTDFYKIPIGAALLIVLGTLATSVVASLLFPPAKPVFPPDMVPKEEDFTEE